MVGTIESDREDEFHERFAEYRTSGEWLAHLSNTPWMELADFWRVLDKFDSLRGLSSSTRVDSGIRHRPDRMK